MSFFVSENIKDRIGEDELKIDKTQKWDAFAVASVKAYKILQYTPKPDGCVVKLQVAGIDLASFIKNIYFIDYIEISGQQFKIKKQELKKFDAIDNASIYITENYLRSP